MSSKQSIFQRLRTQFPPGQLVRYLCVGVFNTVFGYSTYAIALFCLNHAVPHRYLYLTVIMASLLSTPLNITVAWLGYKFLVFRTRGHYLKEWLKCFGVYGVGMLPALLALSAVTRLLQSLFNTHQAAWQSLVLHIAAHLHGHASGLIERLHSTKSLAGYIAGALLQCVTIMLSFVGHRKVTFRRKAEVA